MKNEYNQVNWQQFEQDSRAVASGTPISQLPPERRTNLERGNRVLDRFASEQDQLQQQLERQDQTRKEVEQLHQESIKERDRAALLGKIGSAGLGVIYSADALAHAAQASPFAAARAVGYAWNFGRGVGDKIVGIADRVDNISSSLGFGSGAGGNSGGNAAAGSGGSAPGPAGSGSGGNSGNANPPVPDARTRIDNTLGTAQSVHDANEVINDLRGMPQEFRDTRRRLGIPPTAEAPGAIGSTLSLAQAGLALHDAHTARLNCETRQMFKHAGEAVVHATEGLTIYGDNAQSAVNALTKIDEAINTTDPNERRLLQIEALGHTLGTAQGLSPIRAHPIGSAGQSIVSGTEAYRQFQEFNEISAYSRTDPSAPGRQLLERNYQDNIQMMERLRRLQSARPGTTVAPRQ